MDDIDSTSMSVTDQLAALVAELDKANEDPLAMDLIKGFYAERIAELREVVAAMARKGFAPCVESTPGAINVSVTFDDGREHLVPGLPK